MSALTYGMAQRGGDAARNVKVYGTILRTYDPRIDAWHIQWTVPVTPSDFSMIGRRQGRDVVRLGKTEKRSVDALEFFEDRAPVLLPAGRAFHRQWGGLGHQRGIQRALRCPGLGKASVGV
jgi:hypothetical protein